MEKQKYLKTKGLIMFLSVLGMVAPLSTDMYMPSLPTIAEDFGTSTLMVNMTLMVFFLFMAIGMLLFGPISDEHGRKRPLLVGLSLYGAGSFICIIARSIELMIFARVIEALGAGAMMSLSVAIIKDSFEGKFRDNSIAITMSLSVIAPILSPVIGAVILNFASWRLVFGLLTAIAVFCIGICLLMEETLPDEERNDGGVKESFLRMGEIGRNQNFSIFLIAASIYSAPFMAYLGIASYTYEEFFGLSAGMFALFFAINAAFSVIGPMGFIYINGRISNKKIMWFLILAAFLFGSLIYLFGESSPVVFLCCFIPYGIFNAFMRPFSTAILLEQQEGDTGAASSLLNFTYMLFAAGGMLLGSLGWSSYIKGLAIIIIAFTFIATMIWIAIVKSSKFNMKKL